MSKCKPSVQKIKASWKRRKDREILLLPIYRTPLDDYTGNVYTRSPLSSYHASSFILLPLFRQIKHHDILFEWS